MQNAAFAVCGLDWDYAAFDVADPVAAVGALQTLGFAGANVTIPHKQAVVAACDEADGDAVNTIVFQDGRVLGFNTDREILAGIDATRACLIGAGGAARALLPALPEDTRVFTRSGAWPPDATDCDLVVNATPERQVLLVQPRAGQTVVDLAYGEEETALVTAATRRRLHGDRRSRGARPAGRCQLPPVDGSRAAGRRDAGCSQALAQTASAAAAASRSPAVTRIVAVQSRPLGAGCTATATRCGTAVR